MAVKGLEKRYADLAAIGPNLPALNTIQTPQALQLEEVVRMLPPGDLGDSEASQHQDRQQEEHSAESTAREQVDAGQDEHPTADPGSMHSKNSSINKSALVLALFGWDTVSDEPSELVACGACFRRLGLWLYKTKTSGSGPVYNTLDVENEHMDYCPWKNGQAQSGTGKRAESLETLRNGWELLVQAVKVKHRRWSRATASRDPQRNGEKQSVGDEPAETTGLGLDDKARKASDREWWAKILRMKQVLNFGRYNKSPRRRENGS